MEDDEYRRMFPVAVGDTVERPVNVFVTDSPVRRGVVTAMVRDGRGEDILSVRWDTERGRPLSPPLHCTGYFRHGVKVVHPQPTNGSSGAADSSS